MAIERPNEEDPQPSEPAFFAEIRGLLGFDPLEEAAKVVDDLGEEVTGHFDKSASRDHTVVNPERLKVEDVRDLLSKRVKEVDHKFTADSTVFTPSGDERRMIEQHSAVDKRVNFSSKGALTILELTEGNVYTEKGFGRSLVVRHAEFILGTSREIITRTIDAIIKPDGHFDINENNPFNPTAKGFFRSKGQPEPWFSMNATKAIRFLDKVLQNYIHS
jgi:hypothetical protein